MGYIGAHGVAALHRYKYSGVDHSYVAKYVLQPFWTRCVHLFPLWMPPNGITLMGFMFLVTSALLGYIYSPQLDSPPPRWVHFAHGLLLFLYQTFDAVDGKQARRTSSSSPLGELFDHGCDALACAFESLAFGSTAMCGRNAFWFWVISAVPFYCATWESYFTNTLILPVVNGPTEGLMLIYVTHFFTAFVGAEWWAQSFGKSVPFLSWVPFVNGKVFCVKNKNRIKFDVDNIYHRYQVQSNVVSFYLIGWLNLTLPIYLNQHFLAYLST